MELDEEDVVEADYFKTRGRTVTFYSLTESWDDAKPVAVFFEVWKVTPDV